MTAPHRSAPDRTAAPVRIPAGTRNRARPGRAVSGRVVATGTLAVLAVLVAAGLAGCGSTTSPAPAAAPPATSSAPPASTEPDGPDTAPGTEPAAPGGVGRDAAPAPTAPPRALLWPVTDQAQVAPLQEQVDSGAQPWLLDPTEVALNYATAVYGWGSPQVESAQGGTVVVTDAQGGRATVTLAQPGRTGTTGIWIVTGAQRG